MNERILVVDDDRTTCGLIAALLRRSYDVATAASGEEALALAAQRMPGVVLLDIMMPGIDGIETCRRLKTMFLGAGIQIIMVSAASSAEEQERAFSAGADAYLVKPFDPHVLCSEVRSQLRLREAIGRLASVEAELQSHHGSLERLVEERDHLVTATQDVAVFAIAKLAESRDEDTGEHLIRVRGYSQALAEQLRQDSPYREEITDQFLVDLFRSSPLHDIGKVAISDTILLKPGGLTPKEFDIVKTHTLLGARVLEEVVLHSASGSFLEMAVAIARYHHERFDGMGYPAGLRGTDIPLCARIVALADVFDALASTRPYKPAYSVAQSLRIIREESGKHFDPVVVAAMETRVDEFAEICRRHANRISDAAPPVVPAATPGGVLAAVLSDIPLPSAGTPV